MRKIDLAPETSVGRNPDVLFREIEGEAVLLDPDDGSYFALNETGTAIWHLLEESTTLGQVLDQVTHDYAVSRDDAWQGIVELVGDLIEKGLARLAGGEQ